MPLHAQAPGLTELTDKIRIMKHLLQVGHTSLYLFLKHRSSWVWLFAMPLVFVYFLGLVNRASDAPAAHRPPLRIEGLDTNFLADLLLEELNTGGLRLLPSGEDQPAAATIEIPPDFTHRVLAGQQAHIGFHPRRDRALDLDVFILELRLLRALVALNASLIEAARDVPTGQMPDESQIRQALHQPDSVRLDSRFAGRNPIPAGFAFSLPGILVMYILMNLLIFGGTSLATERRRGILRRIATHPLTRAELISGKIYGLVLLGAVQSGFMLLAGQWVFGVHAGNHPAAVALVTALFTWTAASLGVLIGSVITREDRVPGLCLLLALPMAALGGCWWPLEIAPDLLRQAAFCLPTGWAVSALHQLISFGNGWSDITPHILVLTGFGTVTQILAIRHFRI